MNRKHFTFLLTAISAIFCSNVFAFTVDPTSISENEGNRVNLAVAIDNVDWELAPDNNTCDADVAFRFVVNLEGIDGTGNWSNDPGAGDLSLEMQDDGDWRPVSLPLEHVQCSASPVTKPPFPLFRVVLHLDPDFDEGTQTAKLRFVAQCGQGTEDNPQVPCNTEVNIEILDLGGPSGPLAGTTEGEIAEVVLKSCVNGENTADFQALCNQLVGEAIGGTPVIDALNQIAPEESAVARAPAEDAMVVQNANVGGRMAALRGGATGFSMQGFSLNLAGFSLNGNTIRSFGSGFNTNQASFSSANANGSSDDIADFGQWGIFISGRLIFGDKDATDLERGFGFDTLGLTLGVDYRFTDTFVAGVALGYSDNSVDIDANKGELDADGTSFTVYGSFYPSDNFYMDASYSLGSNNYDQLRNVNYTFNSGTVSQTIAADYDGDQSSFTFGAGYDFNKNGWVFGPTLFVEYTKVDMDAYNESLVSGAGIGWAAHIDKQRYESLIPSIGFQFSKAFSRAWGVIIPQAHVSWAKELKNDDSTISGYFLGDLQANKEIFEIATDSLKEDFLKAGLGVAAMLKNDKSAFLTIDGDFGRELLSTYYINAGFRWSF